MLGGGWGGEAPTHNPGTGPRHKNLLNYQGLGVRKHSNKKQPEGLSSEPPGFPSRDLSGSPLATKPSRAWPHSSHRANSQATRPGGAAGQSPRATRSPSPALPTPTPTAQPSPGAELPVLHRPPGLLSVIPLHHLAPASPSMPGLRLPQETSSKGQEAGGGGGAQCNGHLSSRFVQALLNLLFFKIIKLVPLRQGHQLR